MELASSDAEGAFGGRTESSAPTFKNDSAMQNCRSGPMSTREGQAASVTLLRREQLRKVVRPYIPKYRRGAKSQKRADEGIGPYNRCGGFKMRVASGGIS